MCGWATIMASTRYENNGAQHGKTQSRRYKRENSLYIDVGDNKAVKASTIIYAISEICGEGELYACVPKSGNMYIVTMKEKEMCNLLADGLECNGKLYHCSYVVKDTLNVSNAKLSGARVVGATSVSANSTLHRMERMMRVLMKRLRELILKEYYQITIYSHRRN